MDDPLQVSSSGAADTPAIKTSEVSTIGGGSERKPCPAGENFMDVHQHLMGFLLADSPSYQQAKSFCVKTTQRAAGWKQVQL